MLGHGIMMNKKYQKLIDSTYSPTSFNEAGNSAHISMYNDCLSSFNISDSCKAAHLWDDSAAHDMRANDSGL